jgi:hypothetical protein
MFTPNFCRPPSISSSALQHATMPKRKRENTLEEAISGYEDGLFRALKTAKGFESQRLSKRIRDSKTPVDKKKRLQNEVEALKVCDTAKRE